MLLEWLIITIIVLCIYKRWRHRDIYEMGKRLNSGLRTLPLLGHSYLFIGNNEARMKGFQTLGRDALKKENGLTALWLSNNLYTIVADPLAAEYILKTALEKDELMNLLKLFLGNGSIFAPVSIWKLRRKVLVPTFGPKNIKYFMTIFTKQSSVLIEQLHKVAGTGTISIWKYLTSYTMDSIAEATLGYEMHAQKCSKHPFLEAFDFGLISGAERICSPWLHSDLLYNYLPIYRKLVETKKYLWRFIGELIASKQKEISEKSNQENNYLKPEKGYRTFLELLIQSSGREDGYTNIEITEELMVILIAGNDTSAVASSFVSVMLSRYPEVQKKIVEELQNVFGDSERPATSEDLLNLKYLDAVIRETLRLYTPVPIVTRKVEKELILPSGFKIVPGTGVIVNIWAIHRNSRYWGDDAEQFRPERFLDTPLKHPAAFMPFSFGPRNCIGYQFAMTSIKTVMSKILRNFKILPPNDLPCSEQPPIRLQFDVMMKDVDKFQLRLERRVKK